MGLRAFLVLLGLGEPAGEGCELVGFGADHVVDVFDLVGEVLGVGLHGVYRGDQLLDGVVASVHFYDLEEVVVLGQLLVD